MEFEGRIGRLTTPCSGRRCRRPWPSSRNHSGSRQLWLNEWYQYCRARQPRCSRRAAGVGRHAPYVAVGRP